MLHVNVATGSCVLWVTYTDVRRDGAGLPKRISFARTRGAPKTQDTNEDATRRGKRMRLQQRAISS